MIIDHLDIKIEQIKGSPDRARVEVYNGEERLDYWTMNKSAAHSLRKGEYVSIYSNRIQSLLERVNAPIYYAQSFR